MEYFLDTSETIDSGMGFSHYDGVHLGWLAAFAVTVILCSLWYRKMSEKGRGILKKTLALAMIIMEGLKIGLLVLTDRFSWGYLPFHLCGINIFLIIAHAWKPSRLLDNFLYLVCIPGALAALLFPNWTALPVANIYHIHSSIIHILLVLYPLMQAVNGKLDLQMKMIPGVLGLLALMAIPIYGLNLLLGTNFMFLMRVDAGNPLALFEEMWGNHLYGFPVIIAAVVVVMYAPIVYRQKLKRTRK